MLFAIQSGRKSIWRRKTTPCPTLHVDIDQRRKTSEDRSESRSPGDCQRSTGTSCSGRTISANDLHLLNWCPLSPKNAPSGLRTPPMHSLSTFAFSARSTPIYIGAQHYGLPYSTRDLTPAILRLAISHLETSAHMCSATFTPDLVQKYECEQHAGRGI
jgi:hypothetical protein